MGYIQRDTEGLLVTRLTDTGRLKLSQGNFNISYFQVGDSELNYTAITESSYTNLDGKSINFRFSGSSILEPPFNAQNSTGGLQSTKNAVKYPMYLNGEGTTQYGIPFMDSINESIYNTASPLGFFSSCTQGYMPYITSAYTLNSTLWKYTSGFNASLTVTTNSTLTCTNIANATTNLYRRYLRIFYSNQNASCNCGTIFSVFPSMVYLVTSITYPNPVVDRATPNFSILGSVSGQSRLFFYPSGMTTLYDTVTPSQYWYTAITSYESICTPNDGYSKVWNMNIPWTENPAGLNDTANEGYGQFGSVNYIGTKEYLGYMSSLGQSATSEVYYVNSLGDEVIVRPEDQKAIAIIHYTNNSIINYYGEKFAVEPDSEILDSSGYASNFKVIMPTLMWHKNTGATPYGETFYINPPSFIDNTNIFKVNYLTSTKNSDMNYPGIRYFDLWDNYEQANGKPNRVGKVFPDDKLVVIDDEEIVAAMSWAANRNFTLPAPKVSLVPPNVCDQNTNSVGVLTGSDQTMWVTYLFDSVLFNGMHCNYYQSIQGPSTGCSISTQNVSVQFGPEFAFMNTGSTTGYSLNNFYILAQITDTGERPSPTGWKKMNYTSDLDNYNVVGAGSNNFIIKTGMSSVSFVIDPTRYNGGASYDLSTVLSLPVNSTTDTNINFGDEYFFYGNIETDIQATIYEMRYRINLPNNLFTSSSNPSWNSTYSPYMTEIGLYDSEKNLMILSKFQTPVKRDGSQQAVVKLDF